MSACATSCMMHSVVDVSGLNRISRAVLANAAAAMIGMVAQAKAPARPDGEDRTTAPDHRDDVRRDDAVRRRGARASGADGYEVLVFHATGTGGLTMESFIADGLIAASSTSPRRSWPTNWSAAC